jgi:acyl-CoA synthetase (AMP-forming)/AMP-acid ligase II
METPIATDSLVLGKLLARHARYRPNHTAVVVGHGPDAIRLSYAEFDATVNRWANALAARGKKDMIDSGGVKVYPKDIEEIAAQHPAVREVAVFGIPHDKWGETPLAAIVLRRENAATADELRDWINARVAARYQRVDRVVVMPDFPRSAAGKTLKRELREPYWQGRTHKI